MPEGVRVIASPPPVVLTVAATSCPLALLIRWTLAPLTVLGSSAPFGRFRSTATNASRRTLVDPGAGRIERTLGPVAGACRSTVNQSYATVRFCASLLSNWISPALARLVKKALRLSVGTVIECGTCDQSAAPSSLYHAVTTPVVGFATRRRSSVSASLQLPTKTRPLLTVE